jgi:hypothetical protein
VGGEERLDGFESMEDEEGEHEVLSTSMFSSGGSVESSMSEGGQPSLPPSFSSHLITRFPLTLRRT